VSAFTLIPTKKRDMISSSAMLRTSARIYPQLVPRSLPRCVAGRHLSSTAAGNEQEIMALRDEVRSLHMLLAQQNQQYQILVQQIQSQSATMEKTVEDIHVKVALMASPLERLSTVASVFVHNSEALLAFVHRFERYSRGWVNKYSMGGTIGLILIIWSYRSTMYDRTSEEVAEIASRTLQQESLQRTIQETLDMIANSPETLQTLNNLLQNVLRDPLTLQQLITLVRNALEIPEIQQSLLSLLESILADPALQQQAAEFFLKGLETEYAKQMIELQTQSLVRHVVLDESVQRATALGVKQSFWYSVLPTYLWPRRTTNQKDKE
jgi:hypothetical protein